MIKKWKKNSSKYLLENKIFKMREDSVTSPKLGTDHDVWVMEAPTWVNIIPLTPQREVVMVNQYRFGSEKASLEIPGGMADFGEDPKEAAIRELKEETSIKSVSLIKKIDGLLTYHLPNELLGIIWKGKFKGQKQQWYIMRFNGEEKEININTKHPEFLEWRWVDPDKITELVVEFKLHVYKKVQEEVKKILVN